jgi:hypothetical protein
VAREGVWLNVIQRQLGHANLGTTSVYLQGIDNSEIIETVGRPRRADASGKRRVALTVLAQSGRRRRASALHGKQKSRMDELFATLWLASVVLDKAGPRFERHDPTKEAVRKSSAGRTRVVGFEQVTTTSSSSPHRRHRAGTARSAGAAQEQRTAAQAPRAWRAVASG